jgi:hypothetical protein
MGYSAIPRLRDDTRRTSNRWIKPANPLFALKPVTFRAKGNTDPSRVKHYGLIAEDVAAVDSDLVVYNQEGRPETLRFDSINAMLLNEFLKEHRKVQEQEVTIARLKREMESVVVRLREHESKIQKVRDKIETSELGTEVVDNNQ